METPTTSAVLTYPLTPYQNALVENNMGLVMFCLKRVKVLRHFREDCKQAGMIGLIDAAKSYDGESSSFSTYATICIQRKMWNAVEKEHTAQHSSEMEVSNDEGTGMDALIAPADEVSVDAKDLWSKLDTLPTKQAQAIRLRLVEDMDWRAIGEAMNASRQTVLNWYNQGITALTPAEVA